MTVYVDDMRARYGRMVMCHMIADSDEELHLMARMIGVDRRWHQAPPMHDSHYDIALCKRAAAVALGAVSVTCRELVAMVVRRRETGDLGQPNDAVDWLHALTRQRAAAARSSEELERLQQSGAAY